MGQGNLWGASGKKSMVNGGPDGGYLQDAQYVKEVQFAQTSNLPDPVDPTPVQQGIGVYYTSLNVGGVDFAIIEDRKFKNGPLEVFPEKLKTGRPDHPGKRFPPAELNNAEAKLLGERQLAFLQAWGQDWKNAQVKCVLSQTVFAQAHTSQLIDLDSNGWPQAGRNRALETILKSFAFMIAGDSHLANIVHHGIDEFEDAGYSFCVPSIYNHYPRKWKPEQAPQRVIEGPVPDLGDYLDGLGNKVTMYAHATPGLLDPELVKKYPYIRQATGHGIVRFNKKARTITIECWPRGLTKGPDGRQYPGWPKTISQMDNYGRKAAGFLPTLQIEGQTDPVVQVIREKDNEVVYTIRIKGNQFRPKVFDKGKYTVKIGEGKSMKTLQGVECVDKDDGLFCPI